MNLDEPEPVFDIQQCRAQLNGVGGKEYWRSLEELAQSPAFQELLEREQPNHAEAWSGAVDRRKFLVLMAASLGLAGLSGCSLRPAPNEHIVPYVTPPEGMVLGRPMFFATAMPVGADAIGLLAESHEGRPTKIEGNPDHPSSPRAVGTADRSRFGTTTATAQAAILGLYDPDRSGTVAHLGSPTTWDAFLASFAQLLRKSGQNVASTLKLRVLTGPVTSPSLAWQLRLFLTAFPQARWHVHDPLKPINGKAGVELAFGEKIQPQYHLEKADIIVSFDADFLDEGPGHVRLLHDFAVRRRSRKGDSARLNRLYVIESIPSGTGAIADHRLPARPADIESLARALASQIDAVRFGPSVPTGPSQVPAGWIEALARDLMQHRGRSLILVGERQPASVHALVHALNEVLGNVGRAVTYTAGVEIEPPQGGSLKELADVMASPGAVDVLLVLGVNPVYTAGADLRFAERMSRVPVRIHLGLYEDETAQLCHWHLPEAHFLESWGDVRSRDGTVAFIQPLISPLHGGKTALEVLASLTAQSVGPEQSVSEDRSNYALVRAYWSSLFDSHAREHTQARATWQAQGLAGAFTGGFESWWQKSLRDGLVAGTRLPARTVRVRPEAVQAVFARPGADLELVIAADPAIEDGSWANNGWLQELPRPLTKLTWDNAVHISPATAIRLGLAPEGNPQAANEKVVQLSYHGQQVEGPVWVLPGQADDVVLIHLGFGRTYAGRVGSNIGFNSYNLRTSGQPWGGPGLTIQATDRRKSLACTQHHHLLRDDLLHNDRGLVLAGTVDRPPHMPHADHDTLYNEAEHQHPGNRWGMVIDLGLCTGCSACVVACQAENNIPVVGKEQVMRGREMHWLRIDSYYRGEAQNPETYFQPVPCMQCENAPCEQVCPVEATVHSDDGLNDMVYNRCVGTRYCSNNCPYKVRRFNFLQYSNFHDEALKPGRNPEVSVRSRGVMEKCTYCVQRIRAGQISAERESRGVLDGEVVTACQAVCPAGAIVFGDLADRSSEVAKLRQEPMHYALLGELNTRPRTTYLAALKNPNPNMPVAARGDRHG